MKHVLVGTIHRDNLSDINKVLHIGTFEECEQFANENKQILDEYVEVSLYEMDKFCAVSNKLN